MVWKRPEVIWNFTNFNLFPYLLVTSSVPDGPSSLIFHRFLGQCGSQKKTFSLNAQYCVVISALSPFFLHFCQGNYNIPRMFSIWTIEFSRFAIAILPCGFLHLYMNNLHFFFCSLDYSPKSQMLKKFLLFPSFHTKFDLNVWILEDSLIRGHLIFKLKLVFLTYFISFKNIFSGFF